MREYILKTEPKVLITGNMGYIGPVLVRHLRTCFPNATLIGFDDALFGHCLTSTAGLPERFLNKQIFGDVRAISSEVMGGVDTVVCLAAISNDPMGVRYEAPTAAINYHAAVKLAENAADAGVRNFVFASSCSVYGMAEGGPRKESDALNPLTAYARSKIDTERALSQLQLGDMVVSCLRFATACGMSDRLRLDLVLNDFVASALATGEIKVLSDGTPWRPLINVSDMSRAIEWACDRTPDNGGKFLAVNVGSHSWNYQVKDLAATVAKQIPKTSFSVNKDAPPDKRSYRVDFSLFASLAPQHQAIADLTSTVTGLADGLRAIGFDDPEFRNSDLIRLKVLDGFKSTGHLSDELRWID